MNRIFTAATYIFDPLHSFWESDRNQRAVAGVLIAVFLSTLVAIELKRQGLLPVWLDALPTKSHFYAVNVAFSLVLILEVISLIFTVPCSISKSVGKQFEILALILLRGTFKKLIELPEPIDISGHTDVLFTIGADALGAVAIFALLGVFRVMIRQDSGMKKGEMLFRYVAAKKIVALALLGIFIGMGIGMLWDLYTGGDTHDFFGAFYTVLIFSDILLVLIAQRFLPRFRAVFRNSGFALATLLIRLALTAPDYWNVILGVSAPVFAVLLTLVYNQFYAPKDEIRNEGYMGH
ncbi:MAG: hypothetical protein KKB70_01400 [Proteobacteria bacterium]|nr:hypothetical protein [Pseudomonadota bacterium]MBU1612227.1 hypothetical protein [Pseudomonadota bacterium]